MLLLSVVACADTPEDGLRVSAEIGYPVMIKASGGGGGKGIRKSESPDDFTALFRQVQSEIPGSPIFIMKYAHSARHLEVQLLADTYGNAISLFGRDCSIQRRHQKIIEEAPVTIISREMFREMEQAAVRLAKMVGYVSAGTVEYLYMPEGNTCGREREKYCCMELSLNCVRKIKIRPKHIVWWLEFFFFCFRGQVLLFGAQSTAPGGTSLHRSVENTAFLSRDSKSVGFPPVKYQYLDFSINISLVKKTFNFEM